MSEQDKPMRLSKPSRQDWRDLSHTVSVLVASATAADALETDASNRKPAEKAPDRPVATIYRFELLAAEAGTVKLPEGQVATRDGGLLAQFAIVGDDLNVALQLTGYAALRQSAGRECRMKSADGVIDYQFRFDKSGKATCVLANTEAVRTALRDFQIDVLDDRP